MVEAATDVVVLLGFVVGELVDTDHVQSPQRLLRQIELELSTQARPARRERFVEVGDEDAPDVEEVADLPRRPALDPAGEGPAGQVQEPSDLQRLRGLHVVKRLVDGCDRSGEEVDHVRG